ncbi:hypothetical protein C8R45DRAFT_1093158 [Mycena sanguinolenta]|nr:hypothetical protein C8R45DRAFT_1093158 [Mycena sanguinolenta]
MDLADHVFGKLSSHERQFWSGDGVDLVCAAIDKVAQNSKPAKGPHGRIGVDRLLQYSIVLVIGRRSTPYSVQLSTDVSDVLADDH